MKKLLSFAIVQLLTLALGLNMAFAEEISGGFMGKKVLIAYFSWGGNTQSIAEKIHEKVGGDVFRIETAVPYPNDYNETAYGIAKEQHDKGIKPELKSNGDVSGYDVIFVGTPAWWYTMAPAVMTFLGNNSFEGKIIVPFITHGGGGKYNIAREMAGLAKGAKVLEPIAIYGRGNSSTDRDIDAWLKNVK